jgi:hypothetical protein
MLRNGKQTYIPQTSSSNLYVTSCNDAITTETVLLLSYITATRLTLFWKFPHQVRTTRLLCTEQVRIAITPWTCIVVCPFRMAAGALRVLSLVVFSFLLDERRDNAATGILSLLYELFSVRYSPTTPSFNTA